jgi:putative sigma-54 modulation protein
MEVPQEVRDLAEKKLHKLARVLPGITQARVILTPDKHRCAVEVSVHSRHLDLTATEAAAEPAAALGTVMDELTRQAVRHRDKRRPRKGATPRRDPVLAAGDAAPADEGETGPRIVKARRFVAKPMTVEEAADAVASTEYGFLVFRDASTERVSVVYKRKDGNLGLIEPEA